MIRYFFSFVFVFGGLTGFAERDDEAKFYKLNMSPHAVAMRKHAREAMEKARRNHTKQQEQLAGQNPAKNKPTTRVNSNPGATPEPVPRTHNREASNPPSATEHLAGLMPKPLPARLCVDLPKPIPGTTNWWPLPPTHTDTDRETLINRIKQLRELRREAFYRRSAWHHLGQFAKTKAEKKQIEKMYIDPNWNHMLEIEYLNAQSAEENQARRLGVEPYIPYKKRQWSFYRTEAEKADGVPNVSKRDMDFRQAVQAVRKAMKKDGNRDWFKELIAKNTLKECEQGEEPEPDRQVAATEPSPPAPNTQPASFGSR